MLFDYIPQERNMGGLLRKRDEVRRWKWIAAGCYAMWIITLVAFVIAVKIMM